jgi:hypothetical protein
LRGGRRLSAKPVVIAAADASPEAGSAPIAISRDWDEIIALLAANAPAQLGAMGQMTDEILADVGKVDGIVGLRLNGSRGVTDEGLRHLSGMRTLKRLDLSGTSITDRGLEVLRHLPALENLSLSGTAITDAGARELAHCHSLSRLDLGWTRTGDGAIRALAGKRALTHLTTGVLVTDAVFRCCTRFLYSSRGRAAPFGMASRAMTRSQIISTCADPSPTAACRVCAA